MSSKASFSASIDRDLLDRAKSIAAQRKTTLSALINQHLQHLVDTCEASEERGNSNYRTLLDFSLGRIDDHQAISQLELRSIEDLYRLLAQVGLPRPRLSSSETEKLVKTLQDLGSSSIEENSEKTEVILIPDSGPLLELARQDQLDVLFKPGWTVALVDAVLHEILRSPCALSETIGRWVHKSNVPVLQTRAFERAQKALGLGLGTPGQLHMGNLGLQEVMNDLAGDKQRLGLFVFDDQKVMGSALKKPKTCKLVSTRAFQHFLTEKGWVLAKQAPSQIEPVLEKTPSSLPVQPQVPTAASEAVVAATLAKVAQLPSKLNISIEQQQVVEKIQVISGAAIRLLGMRRMNALQADKKLADNFKNLIG